MRDVQRSLAQVRPGMQKVTDMVERHDDHGQAAQLIERSDAGGVARDCR